ncbi:glycoside hydrolase family 31 protein [Paenibacillus aurantius]|uniref:Glycoside hydrolase family 31 protein n=1 Tax=Paenibacillus aurantius TaxID=2918900 RepID=A0AA96LGY9_9BACL|nr:glycoside hydrolase family 31 protein [Paenibacillus aurantius]WNQ13080.1 glycoside hydrolase family 31 protein [Paenibacillus aurantius]
MIDDNWHENYGTLDFDSRRFPDPRSMVEHLHGLGFTVMLWVCPFITPDSPVFRALRRMGYLIRDAKGRPAIREWWNGFSAILDLTHPEAEQWIKGKLEKLMQAYGIDGFKFDAGDPDYYAPDDVTYKPATPNEQCELWARLGVHYRYNEYRACWKMGGQPLVQRLSDKNHSWGPDGLGSLIPNGLAQGLLGFAFSCPDMVGGGQYEDLIRPDFEVDQELFVRYAQCAALFPMLQFSTAPWRVLDQKHAAICIQAALLHAEMGEHIEELAVQAGLTGEPTIRHLAYRYPGMGYEAVKDQFLLGDHVLVAPVVQKGATRRKVVFPSGKWLGDDGSAVMGPCELEVDAPLERLPWYKAMQPEPEFICLLRKSC